MLLVQIALSLNLPDQPTP